MLTLKAPAKINLTLEVTGRRDDGYLDIASIMQTVSLADQLTFHESDDLTLECDVPELGTEDNLVLQAARLLREEASVDSGARIELRKNIPHSAGLGGGSSDAAATLMGLSRLWNLEMTARELSGLAARVGSDVPFFLHGGTAMVSGRGQRVRPLPPAEWGWTVILAPDIDLPNKTATMYGHLTPAEMTKGSLTRKLAARIAGGGDVPPQFLFNAFDAVAFQAFPGLDGYWNTLHSLGAREIHLAGSGPAIYAPVSRKELGTAIHLMLESLHGWRAYLVEPWRPEDDL